MAGILKKRTIPRTRALPPPASQSSGSPSEDEFDDSEEDEWEADRTAGPSREAGRFEQDNDEEDEDEDDEGMSGSEDELMEREGVAAYESDQGEMLDEDDEDSAVKQLAQIPFGMVLKAQKQLSKGKQQGKGKGKGRAVDGEEEEEGGRRNGKAGKAGKGRVDVESRSNKHAPTAMSTKRPVSRVRQIVEVHKPQARDPRFDALSGQVRTDLFKSSYGFLADQQRSELDQLRASLAAAKKKQRGGAVSAEVVEEMEENLRRMENREVTRRNKEREQEALQKWKKEEKEKQKGGKKVFHLKASAKKDLFAKAKYDELSQDKRKLHKAMDKKRRKIGQKEKKLMPNARPGGGR
ncbi:hypothetical protein JCM11251_004954 [Rhodosporidiobolus azoricus]